MTELKFKEGGDLENGRMYDPVIGRFLGVDPIIADGDNSQSFNSYTYALNNPLGLIDRDGFQYEEAYTGGPIVASISTCSFDTWREMRRQAKEYDKLTYLDCVGIATGYQDELAVLIQRQEQQKYGPSNGGNSLYSIGMGLNAAGFVSSAGEYSNLINGSWRGANGKWNSLEWGGNKWTGARSNALSKAGYFELASRGFFVVGTAISLYQGGDALMSGNYAGAAKSGLDIGMGAIATFGGPPGWIIGSGYFLIDAIGAFYHPMITTPYILPTYAVPDNTYVTPSIFRLP